MAKISVVLPVYNSARFVAQSIQSVLGQTFKDFEIIVVDDGSTDDTASVIGRFGALVSYHYQKNQGAAAARNLGVSRSQGQYVAFLDADDIWYPNKLSAQVSLLETDPSLGFAYSDIDTIDENGEVVEKQFLTKRYHRAVDKTRKSLTSFVFNGPFPYPSTVILKRDVFAHSGGFNSHFRGNYHEDFELWARIAQISAMYFMPTSLVQYRIHGQAGTASANADENWLRLLASLREIWANDPIKLSEVEWYRCRYYSQKGKNFLRDGDYESARACFKESFRIKPFSAENLRRWSLSYLPFARDIYISHKKRPS
jgi:glycosyltransferase involved in cell wall biosynthesis